MILLTTVSKQFQEKHICGAVFTSYPPSPSPPNDHSPASHPKNPTRSHAPAPGPGQ